MCVYYTGLSLIVTCTYYMLQIIVNKAPPMETRVLKWCTREWAIKVPSASREVKEERERCRKERGMDEVKESMAEGRARGLFRVPWKRRLPVWGGNNFSSTVCVRVCVCVCACVCVCVCVCVIL